VIHTISDVLFFLTGRSKISYVFRRVTPNLEYDLEKKGERYTHIKRILRELTGAEDALIVNNNAACVLLCLNTLAKERRSHCIEGELVRNRRLFQNSRRNGCERRDTPGSGDYEQDASVRL
jgi:seryl-tRNA(Sec) selenium transferase